MFRKIRLLVSNYDQRFWDWLEGKSSSSGVKSEGDRSSKERSKETNGCLDAPGTKVKIPDPWD